MVIKDNILYMCDKDYSVVRTLNLTTKIITTFMGGTAGWTADGSPPINTSLQNPTYIGFDNNGIFYISDTGNYCIRRINTTNRVQTVVGTGTQLGTIQYTGNVQSTGISLGYPTGFVFDQNNNLIFCDSATSMIYIVNKELRMNPLCGSTNSTPISALVSSLTSLSVSLDKPYGVAKDSIGSLYVTSYNSHQIFKMTQDPGYSTYSISVIVGMGKNFGGFNSNDMFSQYATLNNPTIIQVLPDSSFYFIDFSNKMIRYVLPSIYDNYSKGVEGMLPYAPLSIIASYNENTYNTTALTGGEETSALLNDFTSNSICVDFVGNIYVCNTTRNNILKFDTNGTVTAFVTGLSNPRGISIYNNSVLYISDNGTNSVKLVSINTPSIIRTLTTITDPQLNAIYNLGYLFTLQPSLNKISVYNIKTDTILADINVVSIASSSSATIPKKPYAIAVDLYGNLFVSIGDIIEKYRISYTGVTPVISAPILFTSGLGMCPGITHYNNNLYYISNTSYIIYSKNASDTDGAIGTIIAGTQGYNGVPINGTYSNTTTLYRPISVIFDNNGTMYLLDGKPNQSSTICKITPYNFLKKDVAYILTGSRVPGTTMSGVIGYFAKYKKINSTCFGPDGSIYISDTENHCIWQLNIQGYVILYAGTPGTTGISGIGGIATSARLNQPKGITVSSDGILYICDYGNNRVLSVSSNKISLVAGTGIASTQIINSTIAINAAIQNPSSVILDNYGNIMIACVNQIYRINIFGIMNTYIGGGTLIPATGLAPSLINISQSSQLAINSSNELHFINRNQIFKLSSSGTITTIAGTQSQGFSPDGTVAISAMLSSPQGLVIDSNNSIYVSDTENNIIRVIKDGIIKTVAGTSTSATAVALGNIENVNGSGKLPLQTTIMRPGQIAMDLNNRLLVTQIEISQITLIPFTDTNPCGLLANYIEIQSQGQGINILNITAYDSNGNIISLSSNQAASQGILQPANTNPYVSATNAFNENLLINIGSARIISFVNIKSSVSLGMKFLLLNSQKNILYQTTISSNITIPTGEYIIFKSVYSNTQCSTVSNLPPSYKNIVCGIPNVRYVKIRGNGSTPVSIGIAQLVVIENSGANVALKKTVTANSNPGTGPNMVDGYYGSKSMAYESNRSNNEWVQVDLGVDTVVTFIFLYMDSIKTTISGLLLDLLDSNRNIIQSRLIQTVPNIASLQYIRFDFRSNNLILSCTSFNDISQLYKLPSGSTYRNKKIRYIRIGTPSNTFALSQIVVKSADDGSNLAYQKTVIANIISSANTLPLDTYVSNRFSNIFLYSVYDVNAYLQVDLGADYNVSDVIIYSPQIFAGSTASYTYNLTTYASDGTVVSNETTIGNQNTYSNINASIGNLSRLITPNPKTAMYSLVPLYGIPNIRYIRCDNEGGVNPIQISQIIVIDKNGINVAYNKTVRSLTGSATSIVDGVDSMKSTAYLSNTSANTEYVEIDLGSEYEIILMKYWNAPTNQAYARNNIIRLYNSLHLQLGKCTLTGGTASEVFDLRNMTSPGPFVALTYADSALTDPYLTGVIRARYIRIVNPGLVINNSEIPPTLSQIIVYDLFGANIAIGKPTSCSSDSIVLFNPVSSTATTEFIFNNIPGDWWEVDLGDEYSISSVILNSTTRVSNIPLTFYNKYREEMRRVFTNTTATISGISLPTLQLLVPPTTRSGACVRFIRIENTNYNNGSPSAPTGVGAPIVIRQIVAIDARGINVAVGKATRNSNFGGFEVSQSYGAVNGRFDSTYVSNGSTNEWWEVDLGDNYDIKTVLYYNDTVAPQTTGMRIFFLDSYRYIQDYRDIVGTTLKQTFNFPATAAATPLSIIQNYGVKARYVILQNISDFKVCQIAVIDSLGNNVALGKSSATLTNGKLSASTLNYTVAANIAIDLGEEYYITNVIGYSLPASDYNRTNDIISINEINGIFDTSLSGTTVILKDAYNRETATKTFTNESCKYNVKRWTDITFGNAPYYCSSGESLARNWETGLTTFGPPTCDACPTTYPTYSGSTYNKCYNKCATGYDNDLNRDMCVENKVLTENKLKASTAFLNTQITTATTATNGTLSMPFYLSKIWNTDKTAFINKFFNKTVTAVTSSWVNYAADYVINTWNLTIGGVAYSLWDTNPFGRPLELTSQPSLTASAANTIRTFASKRVEESTIIPPQYYNTNYYQFYLNPATSTFDFVDIPMNSFLNTTGTGWAYDKISGATYCESLDFTGYVTPPVPTRRARLVTANPSTPTVTAPPSTVYTVSTSIAPYAASTTCSAAAAIAKTCSIGYTTTYLLQDGGRYPLALYPPSGPADTNDYVPDGYTKIGNYKYSGSGAMGDDNGRFGINFLGITPITIPDTSKYKPTMISALGAFMYNGIPDGAGQYFFTGYDQINRSMLFLKPLPAFNSFSDYSPMYLEFSQKSIEGTEFSNFLKTINTDTTTNKKTRYKVKFSSNNFNFEIILVSHSTAYNYYMAGTTTSTSGLATEIPASYADDMIGYSGPFMQTVRAYTNPDGTAGTKKLFRINSAELSNALSNTTINIGEKFTVSYVKLSDDIETYVLSMILSTIFQNDMYRKWITMRQNLYDLISIMIDNTYNYGVTQVNEYDTYYGNYTTNYTVKPGKQKLDRQTAYSSVIIYDNQTSQTIQTGINNTVDGVNYTMTNSNVWRIVYLRLTGNFLMDTYDSDTTGGPRGIKMFSNAAITSNNMSILNAQRTVPGPGSSIYSIVRSDNGDTLVNQTKLR